MPTVARECTDALSRTVCNLLANESFGQPKTFIYLVIDQSYSSQRGGEHRDFRGNLWLCTATLSK